MSGAKSVSTRLLTGLPSAPHFLPLLVSTRGWGGTGAGTNYAAAVRTGAPQPVAAPSTGHVQNQPGTGARVKYNQRAQGPAHAEHGVPSRRPGAG